MTYQLNAIRPYLYITAYSSLVEKSVDELGITHVIDATNNQISKDGRLAEIRCMQVDVDDLVDVDMRAFFESTADFIQEARDQGGKCLVFCNVGMSRSATLCIMYLVIHENLTLREAYSQVEKSRRIIAPNLGFWRQMIGYEKEKNDGNSTVEMIENAQGFMVPDVYLKKT